MNYKQAFGSQSLELGEGLKRCLHVRSYPFSCVSNPRLIPKLLCSITSHTSLGVKTVAERDGHSLNPDLFASTPRPFLALSANAVDIEIKRLLPAAGPNCMQPSAFCNFAVGPGLSVPAHEVFTGKKLETEVSLWPRRLIFSRSLEHHRSQLYLKAGG